MKNLGEKIEIGSGFREEDGTRLEPELQPVRRTIATEAEANAGQGGPQVGAIPTTISAEMTAIDAAEALARQCRRCAHWRPEEWNWRAVKANLLGAGPEGHATLNLIRAEILGRGAAAIPGLDNGNGDFDDVDHAVAGMGLCKAMTALTPNGEPIASFPNATCPDGYENLFTPRGGGEARRSVESIRDAILHTANKR